MAKKKTKRGWVAMNPNEFDLENISFYNTKREAKRCWGNKQKLVPVKIIFNP